ncbi:phosphopantetheine-binding protein, partial [Actinomadura rubrisoli]|uniref:phosphopantetheine-binding protein n=1 Tax=Actinomadura rubrisoli TaxID=2530368 RepID=UPI001FB6C828
IDTARLQHHPALPPVLRGLLRGRRRATASAALSGPSLAERLEGLTAEQRTALVLEAVTANVSTVLGHAAGDAVGGTQTFRDLGFDSLTAVELRNRLNTATGLRLSATLIFDHPTPAALAEHLLEQLAPAAPSVLAELERLEAAVATAGAADLATLATRLTTLVRTLAGADADGSDLEAATDDELFETLDTELSIS